jgi:uncharacterized protein involved in response to NO
MTAAPAQHPSYFKLCCEEPFRIFFPLGVIIGISGVSLWPLFFSGLHKFYPGIMHARMMIEGFMGSFVIGFLATAAPRLTGTPHCSPAELRTLLVLLIGAVGTHIAERSIWADGIFLGLLIFFAARMAWRFAQRTEAPPPGFVLVAFGFLNAIVGTILLIISAYGEGHPYPALLGSLLLYQGFVLYLVLGVGAFLLPRILKIPVPEMEETRELTGAWKRRAIFAVCVGVALLVSFLVEVYYLAPKAAGAIRFLAAGTYLLTEIAAHRGEARSSTVTWSLRLALVLLVLGLFFPVLWPWQRVAGLHLVFIGGFTLITFTVATRVVLGHSGHEELLSQPMPFLWGAAFLLALAAVFRVVGDFQPAARGSLLSLASYLWMVAAVVWGWWVLPKVRFAEAESLP